MDTVPSSAEDGELHVSGRVDGKALDSRAQSYSFSAPRHRIFRIHIESWDLPLHVKVIEPDGSVLISRQTPLSGATVIAGLTGGGGRMMVVIEPKNEDGRARRFSICLEEMAAPNQAHLAEIAASKELAEGDELAAQWDYSKLVQAGGKFRLAAATWGRLGDDGDASSALLRSATIYAMLGQLSPARRSFESALALAAKSHNVRLQLDVLNALAELELDYSQFDSASRHAELAKARSLSENYQEGYGRALAELGLAESCEGRKEDAATHFNEALAVWAKTPDRFGEALTLLYGSSLNSWKSNFGAARDELDRALAITREVKDEFIEAQVLTNIGNVCMHAGELECARSHYSMSLEVISQIGSAHLKAEVLDDFGFYLESVGQKEGGRLYAQAVSLAEDSGDGLLYAVVLSDLSRASISDKKPRKALQFCARERSVAHKLGDPAVAALALRDTGEALMELEEPREALDYFTQAMGPRMFDTDSTERANTQIEAGDALERLGRRDDAKKFYMNSAALCQSLGCIRTEADARFRIARLEQAEGLLPQALDQIEKSVALIEELRTKVSADDTRILWFSTFQSIYKSAIDILMRSSSASTHSAAAKHSFEIAERSVARTFVELMHDAQVDDKQLQSLAAERSYLRRLLSEKTENETRLLDTASKDRLTIRETASEISGLQARLKEIDAKIQAAGPEALSNQAEPIGIDQARSLLGKDDLILEYSLDKDRSYLWAISVDHFDCYTLAPKAEIERAIRDYREEITDAPSLARPESLQGIHEHRLAVALGRMLLGPVEDQLDHKRILIVADAALQYLPFGVLMDPSSSRDGANGGKRLSDDHEIINLPSVTTLAMLRNRQRFEQPASKELLVVADPVYEKDDPRIPPSRDGLIAPTHAGYASNSAPNPSSRSGAELPRLLGSREEAEMLRSLTPEGKTDMLLDFEANRERAMSPEIGRYRIIHFAAHSVFDDKHPESSGIALSQFDRSGKPEEGDLRLRDIFNMRLSADLVVLSSCDSALGADVRGEGIVGMTRGFMYAGATSVVATLWKVDDEVTSVFMQHFYTEMLRNRRSVPDALRLAQKEIRRHPRWKSPYYWGAFIIEGDWRPRE